MSSANAKTVDAEIRDTNDDVNDDVTELESLEGALDQLRESVDTNNELLLQMNTLLTAVLAKTDEVAGRFTPGAVAGGIVSSLIKKKRN